MNRILHIKLTVMALLWAGGFISAKMIAGDAGPFTICFLRFLIATVFITMIARQREQRAVWDLPLFGMVLGAAFLGVFCYNFFFFTGIRYLDAGRGSVIVSTVPIVVALISAVLFRERLGLWKYAGIGVSLAGAWIVISKGAMLSLIQTHIGKGEFLMMGCVLCAAGFTLFSNAMLVRLTPLNLMAAVSALGTAFVSGPALLELQNAPTRMGSYSFVLNLLYLAVGPSVIAVMFYYDAIKSVGPSRASQYMNLMPVFSVILAMVFLGEHLTGSLILGGGLVTTGLYLTNAGAA